MQSPSPSGVPYEKEVQKTMNVPKKTIVAIGAHPDDIEAGCGGALRNHINQGYRVGALVLTKGERGAHHPESTECVSSLSSLGVQLEDILILDFPDGKVAGIEVISAIEEFLERYTPDIVYSHTERDRHQDHRNTYLATAVAARNTNTLLLYEAPSTSSKFEPHHYVDIRSTINNKLAALAHYTSQLNKGTVLHLDFVKAQAIYWGYKNTCRNNTNETPYAEAFEINHSVVIR
ncbi:MAG: PIG-L deacetylase family protein [Nanoarchaeota archaeon]